MTIRRFIAYCLMAVTRANVGCTFFVLLVWFLLIYARSDDNQCFKDRMYVSRYREGCWSSTWRYFKPSLSAKTTSTEFKRRTYRKFAGPGGYIIGFLLLCGDIISQPGPNASQHYVKLLTINARSLKSKHRVTQIPVAYNLSRVQDLVYADNSDVVCINETWLNSDFDNQELLHTGYTIYRKDR